MRLIPSREPADTKEQLASDFKNLVKDAEALLRETGSSASEGINQARAKFQERVDKLKSSMLPTQPYALRRTREVAQITGRYVRENPWQVVGAMAAIGVLVGFMAARR